jgi:hypothetical protein
MPLASPYIDTSTLLSFLDFADNKPLLIETRPADGEWPIWRPNQITFQVVQLDAKTNDYRYLPPYITLVVSPVPHHILFCLIELGFR